jgi:hypothetical protein
MDTILTSNYPRGLDADLGFKKLDIRGHPADSKTVQTCQVSWSDLACTSYADLKVIFCTTSVIYCRINYMFAIQKVFLMIYRISSLFNCRPRPNPRVDGLDPTRTRFLAGFGSRVWTRRSGTGWDIKPAGYPRVTHGLINNTNIKNLVIYIYYAFLGYIYRYLAYRQCILIEIRSRISINVFNSRTKLINYKLIIIILWALPRSS